jgi:hypothetical protein
MRLGKQQVSPTGLTLWPIEAHPDMSIIWPGPGSGLFLGIRATEAEGNMTRIQHPTANAVYESRLDAGRAARAFAEAA